LIQAIRSAPAILVDSFSYVVSVATLLWIRDAEPDPRTSGVAPAGFFTEMWEGIKVVLGHPVIRLIAGCTATTNLGSNMAFAIVLLFAYNQLGLTPGQVGAVFAIGSIGALIGAVVAVPIARRIGLGPTIAVATCGSVFGFLIPLATFGYPFLLLSAAFFGILLTGSVYNINQVSLRQAIVPVRLQGRLNATVRTIIWGTIPVGNFLGGVLGTRLGLVPTLYIGAAIATLSVIFILAGPVRLKEQPEPAD
jgi:predicted MFS family arabinose efflux permease